VVRRRYTYIDPRSKKERVDYTYALHEAYYDEGGHVGALTEKAVGPFGENVEELRHSWVMMAEAFGKPILDYGKIPEPGMTKGWVPHRQEESEGRSNRGDLPDQVKRELKREWSLSEEDEYRIRVEEERLEKEKIHNGDFVGTPSPKELIERMCSDYRRAAAPEASELERGQNKPNKADA